MERYRLPEQKPPMSARDSRNVHIALKQLRTTSYVLKSAASMCESPAAFYAEFGALMVLIAKKLEKT